jgi:hypothetical protein
MLTPNCLNRPILRPVDCVASSAEADRTNTEIALGGLGWTNRRESEAIFIAVANTETTARPTTASQIKPI